MTAEKLFPRSLVRSLGKQGSCSFLETTWLIRRKGSALAWAEETAHAAHFSVLLISCPTTHTPASDLLALYTEVRTGDSLARLRQPRRPDAATFTVSTRVHIHK